MINFKELFITTTDTVPGIGAPVSLENKKAIIKIKKRDPKKQIIIMIGSMEQARAFKEWNKKAEKFASKYWPGATTLVLSNDLALRIPNNKKLQNLLIKLGPVYMTSSNISGKRPLSYEEAINKFSQISTHYNFGQGSGKPSTIINVEDGTIIRK